MAETQTPKNVPGEVAVEQSNLSGGGAIEQPNPSEDNAKKIARPIIPDNELPQLYVQAIDWLKSYQDTHNLSYVDFGHILDSSKTKLSNTLTKKNIVQADTFCEWLERMNIRLVFPDEKVEMSATEKECRDLLKKIMEENDYLNGLLRIREAQLNILKQRYKEEGEEEK